MSGQTQESLSSGEIPPVPNSPSSHSDRSSDESPPRTPSQEIPSSPSDSAPSSSENFHKQRPKKGRSGNFGSFVAKYYSSLHSAKASLNSKIGENPTTPPTLPRVQSDPYPSLKEPTDVIPDPELRARSHSFDSTNEGSFLGKGRKKKGASSHSFWGRSSSKSSGDFSDKGFRKTSGSPRKGGDLEGGRGSSGGIVGGKPIPPSRVISLLGAATEVIVMLGLEDYLVGCSHECTRLANILSLPCVSSPAIGDVKNKSSGEIDHKV